MTTASDALSAMRSTAAGGEVAGAWNLVVQTYQRAGQQGASVVGPAIDQLSGGNPQTTTLTHRAWGNNGLLANINSGDSATKEDADAAKRFVDSMIQDLQTALNIANANPHPMAPFATAASVIAKTPGGAAAAQHYAPTPYTAPAYVPPVASPPDKTLPHDDMREVKRFGPALAGAGIGFAVGGPLGAMVGGVGGILVGIVLTSDK